MLNLRFRDDIGKLRVTEFFVEVQGAMKSLEAEARDFSSSMRLLLAGIMSPLLIEQKALAAEYKNVSAIFKLFLKME